MKIVTIFKNFLNDLARIFTAFYRDLCGIFLLIKVESRLKSYEKNNITMVDLFRTLCRKQPNKPCIIFYDQVWTFQDMENYSNKIAELFLKKFKLKKGDCVALLMENKPEYVGLWIGLAKIGCISALINTNLKSQQLVHTIQVASPKCIVFSNELKNSIETIQSEIDKDIYLICDNDDPKKINSNTDQKSFINLNELLAQTNGEVVQPSEKIKSQDIMMYIYTSGTTGLPKPAVIKHSRYCAGGISFYEAASLTKNDIIYITLPIYHANGGIIGIGSSLCSGATIVLRKKFSASNFWKECIENKCTAFIYVGEICRFLINQSESSLDRKHFVRKAIGNGLRANVWRQFNARFGIKCIEFYAASEGNCTMINLTSQIGACGFVPIVNRFFQFLPIFVIKIDDQMNPIRDSNGYCIACKPHEKGLLIGLIGKSTKTAFNGYANNTQASNKKIIVNVFKKGQQAFNSGDLMMYDSLGYMYFCDRLGDTYRWRGENVATVEVENVISKALNSIEVIVYGVEVPDQEGRAGMAAIASQNVIIEDLNEIIKNELPPYARPIFLRLLNEVEHTGTFKVKKNNLVEEGFNVGIFNDKTYYLDTKDQTYKELTKIVLQEILNKSVRF